MYITRVRFAWGLSVLGWSGGAWAAEITVDSASDAADETEVCTLRAAIEAANSNTAVGGCAAGSASTVDTIRFDIGASGVVHTIQLAEALPTVTEAVAVDGYTQPGAAVRQVGATLQEEVPATILIEIDASKVPPLEPFMPIWHIAGSGSTIRGLALYGHDGTGAARARTFLVQLDGDGDHVFVGNHVGTDASGLIAMTHMGGRGLLVGCLLCQESAADGIRIGGLEAAERNVFSGVGSVELAQVNGAGDQWLQRALQSYGATDVQILGNIFGYGADAVTPLPNGHGENVFDVGRPLRRRNVVIEGNLFLDTVVGRSLQSHNRLGLVMRDNVFHALSDDLVGSVVVGGVDDAVIEQNVFELQLQIRGNGIVAGHNTIELPAAASIPALRVSQSTDTVIEGNVLSGGTEGIRIVGARTEAGPEPDISSGLVLDQNTVRGASGAGIAVDGYVVDLDITNNTISDNGGHGVSFAASREPASWLDEIQDRLGADGRADAGTGITVQGNQIHDNGGAGVLLGTSIELTGVTETELSGSVHEFAGGTGPEGFGDGTWFHTLDADPAMTGPQYAPCAAFYTGLEFPQDLIDEICTEGWRSVVPEGAVEFSTEISATERFVQFTLSQDDTEGVNTDLDLSLYADLTQGEPGTYIVLDEATLENIAAGSGVSWNGGSTERIARVDHPAGDYALIVSSYYAEDTTGDGLVEFTARKRATDGILRAGTGTQLEVEISGNSMSGNGGLGIENSAQVVQVEVNDAETGQLIGFDVSNMQDGLGENDPQDADAGPNGKQNHPVLDSAVRDGSTLTIRGSLNSEPAQSYRIEFFMNSTVDADGNGQGETPLGSVEVSSDDAGDASFETEFEAVEFTDDVYINASATQLDSGGTGITSELGLAVAVTEFVEPGDKVGCGCASTGSPASVGLVFLPLLLWRRRTR